MQIAVVGLGRMGANIVRAGLCPEQRSFGRFASRGQADFADRLLSAMLHEFGGHMELKLNKKVSATR